MTPPGILLGLSPLAERPVEGLLFGPQAAVTVLTTAAEADELLTHAQHTEARAVLLSADLSGLTPGHCARLRANGLRLLGLALDEHDVERFQDFGLDEILLLPLTGERLAAAVAPAAALEAIPVEQTDRGVPSADDRAGGVLAVVGGKGAPGASEFAISLAALAAERWRTLLIEIDLLGGGLDLRLGADPRHGSLLGLTRAVTTGDGAVAELLERWLCGGERGWPHVLLTPPDPLRQLPELSGPGTVAKAIHAAGSVYPLVVCDVGYLLDDGGETGQAVRVHREALLAAGAVVLLLGARDDQLRHGLRQLDLLLGTLAIPRERLRIVVNGTGASGVSSTTELGQAVPPLLAERGLAIDAWLPYDGRGLKRAARLGIPLALAHRRSAYTRALARLLDELFLPVGPPAPRERKTRLLVSRARPERAMDEEVALPWRS